MDFLAVDLDLVGLVSARPGIRRTSGDRAYKIWDDEQQPRIGPGVTLVRVRPTLVGVHDLSAGAAPVEFSCPCKPSIGAGFGGCPGVVVLTIRGI